jgi:hypothetical protein
MLKRVCFAVQRIVATDSAAIEVILAMRVGTIRDGDKALGECDVKRDRLGGDDNDATKPIRFELYLQELEPKGGINWPFMPDSLSLAKVEEESQSRDDVTEKPPTASSQIQNAPHSRYT